jgi:hypothetical protein
MLPSSKLALVPLNQAASTTLPSADTIVSLPTLSEQRIHMYLDNTIDPQIMHRHNSSAESIRVHTHIIGQFIASFDATTNNNDA